MITTDIMECLVMSDHELIHATMHVDGWVRRDGMLTRASFARIDEHIWTLVDAAGAPEHTQPCGWSWAGIRDSSHDAREIMAIYLRRAIRHHVVWSASAWESN